MKVSKTTKVDQRIPWSEKASYATASGGGNIITQILGTFLVSYLTDSVGIAAASIATMMLVARFIDAVSDLLMGTIIDKTKTKWGKARPWLLISAPIIGIALVIAFSIPSSMSDGGKLVYAYLSYIFLNCICFTAFMVSHTALLSRITLNGHERQKMASLNQIFNQIGGLAVTTFMVGLVAKFGWQMTAVIYGIAAAVLILIGFFGTKEHLAEADVEHHIEERVPFKVALSAMLKNKYFYMLTAIFILILAQAAGPGSMTYYYCKDVLGDLGFLSFISACGIVPTMIINLFVPTLAKKFGRRNCFMGSALLNTLGFFLCGIGSGNLVIVAIGTLTKGFAAGVLFGCGFAMAPDVVDYGEWKTGVRSEGLINSCVSFGQKVGLGVGPAIATAIIGAGGYIGTAEVQTASAVSSINFAFSYFGMILSLLMVLIAFFMNIDKHSAEMTEALKKKHGVK
ncbi:MFS transporter [Blautia producta]|uniref:Glucuronide carrier protein n=1 Tax=Blautia producta TaxID=33035 RepID=A0A4P6LXQ1_9FIRM|nr:glycoside-pentoside-hexuronide (GPH):cation symporter [Blautia producta]QBE97401.1 Glucuronide carrier protein [Blautia producta]